MTATDPHSVITCSRCGDRNNPDRYFCKSCGMGLELLLPPGETIPRDVDLGSLLKSAFVGGILGSIVGFLAQILLQLAARHFNDFISPARFPFLYFAVAQLCIPFFFAMGSSLWLYLKGRSHGLPVSFLRTAVGAGLAVLLSFLILGSSKVLGVTALALLPPISGARFGLGVLSPLWTPRRIFVFAAVVIVVGASLIWLKKLDEPPGPPPTAITWCGNDQYRQLWVVDGLGRLFSLNDESRFELRAGFSVPGKKAGAVLRLSQDRIILRLAKHGIVDIQGSTSKEYLQRRNVSSLLSFQGKLYAGTDKGCFFSAENTVDWQPLQIPDELAASGSDPYVTCLAIVDDDVLVGIAGAGLLRYQPTDATWHQTGFADPFPVTVLSDAESGSISVAAIGSVYDNSGDLSSWRDISTDLPNLFLPETFQRAPDGTLFVAGRQNIFIRENGRTAWKTLCSTPASDVSGLAVDERGQIYCGTREGLFVYRNNREWQRLQLPPPVEAE